MVAFVINQAISLFMTTLTAVVNAVGYHDLRMAKEGIGAAELEAVFD
jgi:hypothetical protein